MNTLKVSGMSCGACVRHVTDALQPLDGVDTLMLDLQAGLVKVQGPADPATLIAALDAAGYPAEVVAAQAAPAAAKTGCGGNSGCCCN